jgi:hypothetical protein
MCLGMGLAYQSAFRAPAPRHMKVAVVGVAILAQPLGGGPAFCVAALCTPAVQSAVGALGTIASGPRRAADRQGQLQP